MVAPAAISDPAVAGQPRAVYERLGRAVLVTTTLTLWALAAYLAWRRTCAGPQQPLDARWLAVVGLGGVGLIGALRGGWQSIGVQPFRHGRSATAWWLAPSPAVWVLLAALALPGTPRLGQAIAWGSVLVGDALWLTAAARGLRRTAPSAARPHRTPPDETSEVRAVEAAVAWTAAGEAVPGLPPEVSQQLTRFRSPQGGDVAEGLLRAAFAPGQRSRNLHVAFCPPLPGRPQVDVQQVAGPALRVKVADAQAFGIRFDVRLQAASPQEEQVLIHFQACCEPSTA